MMMKSKIMLIAISISSLLFSIFSNASRILIPEPIPSILFGAGMITLAEFAKRVLKIQT